jgi:hypothetical protein
VSRHAAHLFTLAALAALAGAPRAALAAPDEAVAATTPPTGDAWHLTTTGYAQVDSVAWSQASLDELDPATGAPLNQTTLLIRRARLELDARKGPLAATLELDGNTLSGPALRLLRAEVGADLLGEPSAPGDQPWLAATAGLMKIPFGAEVPTLERFKPFLESPTWARALFPGSYDVGAALRGGLGRARWVIALMDGAPAGDAQWKGRDPSASYDVVGRLGAVIEGPRHLRVEVGLSGLHGTGLHPGAPPTKDSLTWVDANQDGVVQLTELQIIPGSPGTPSQRFGREAIGADLTVRWCSRVGDGAAFAEAALAENLDRGVAYADPVAAARTIRELGLSLGVTQRVLDRGEVGVRYDRYDADRDATTTAGVALVGAAQVYTTVAVMAAARYLGARLVVEYDHERNPLGRALDGTPTTRAADRLTLRAQVGF